MTDFLYRIFCTNRNCLNEFLITEDNKNDWQKKDKNLVITENSQSLITQIAKQLKCEIIDHNKFIGGRYSVLSETGMLPAYLMGLNPKKFKVFNNLINKSF